MKKILITWIIISLILVGGLTYLGINIKLKNKDYYQLEDKLREAAQDYYAQYPNELPANNKIITVERLIITNFLNELKYKGETCNGYVIVKKNYLSHKYLSYLKCPNYQTKKYNFNNEGATL